MHGKAKIKTSVSEQEKKKKEREAKVVVYKKLMIQLWEKRRREEFDDDALNIITEVLSCNPDIYTLWNFRRQILLVFLSLKDSEELSKILKSELSFTESCIKVNPKSYSAWHHRQWLLEKFPEPNLHKELHLCTIYLKMDERNFHCWDYRRWVAAKLNVPDEKELEYTMEKINDNFSNYSSWHYRSKLLPRVHPDPAGIRPICEHLHLNELDLVVNAAFTDPNDQSAWFYQRWLLGRTDSVPKPIRAMITSEGELLLAFTSPISPSLVKLNPSDCTEWDQMTPCLLRKVLDPVTDELDVTVGDINYIVKLSLINERGISTWSNSAGLEVSSVSPALASVLHDQLDMCNQLLEFEPNSKWTLLTSVHIMVILDRYKYRDYIMKRLTLLEEVDPLRVNYYSHLLCKYTIEYLLEMERKDVSLISSNLKSLLHMQYLLLVESVDFSDNCLEDEGISDLVCLQMCKKLKLDGNKLTSMRNMPRLPHLESLSLSRNHLENFDEILPFLDRFPSLKFLDLSQNLVSNVDRPPLGNYSKIEFILQL